jgi:hypothetical protein
MIAFEVTLNGKRVCTAGVEDFGVLSTILTWVRRSPEHSRDGNTIEEELTAEVSALDTRDPKAGEHLKWLSETLRLGDSISIRIVDVEKVDPPTSRYCNDPEADARAKRQYYERLKREYGD